MTRMAITIRKGPVNRQCVRPHLRELMMQANPIALNMKVQTTARGVGSSPKAPSMANPRSEEHTSELPSLMRISYAVFCLKKKNIAISHIQFTAVSTRQNWLDK